MSGNIPASPFHSPPPLVRLRLEKPQAHADRATGVGLLEKAPDPEATDAEAAQDGGIVVPARLSQTEVERQPWLAGEAFPPARDVAPSVIQGIELRDQYALALDGTIGPGECILVPGDEGVASLQLGQRPLQL